MKRLDYKTVSLGVFTLLIVCSFLIQSLTIGQNGADKTGLVGPATIPRVILFLIALVGTACVWTESRIKEQYGQEEIEGRRTILSVALMTVVVLLLEIVGFLVAGILFLTGEILLAGGGKPDRKQVGKTLALSAACGIVLVAVFRYGFNIGIPILPPVF